MQEGMIMKKAMFNNI